MVKFFKARLVSVSKGFFFAFCVPIGFLDVKYVFMKWGASLFSYMISFLQRYFLIFLYVQLQIVHNKIWKPDKLTK